MTGLSAMPGNVELENHGQDILEKVDDDVATGRIEIFMRFLLRRHSMPVH